MCTREKTLLTFFIFAISGWSFAEPLKTVFNPFTGKQDYITRIDTNTIIPGTNVTITGSNGTVTVNSTGGGGGSSTLAIGLGSTNTFVTQISSPTQPISFDNSQFNGQLIGTSTGFVSIAYSTNAQTGNYTTTGTDSIVVASCTVACTITLSTPTFSGKVIMIIQASTNTVTVSPPVGTLISLGTTALMNAVGTELDVVWDKLNWWVK